MAEALRIEEPVPSVLLVEASPTLGRFVCTGLRIEGFEAEHVPDGPTALERLSQRRYDLALLDLLTPGPGGAKLATTVKERFPHVAVILTSAYPVSRTTLSRYGLDAVRCVRKPYTVGELLCACSSAMALPSVRG